MSLPLDARQRAMLEEMGVRVWLPEENKAAPAQASALPSSAQPRVPAAIASAAPAPGRHPPGHGAAATTTTPAEPPQPRTRQVESARAAPPADERAAAIARMDWTELQAAVSGCRACALCDSRKNTVFGVGQHEAPVDWLIVGEAPGENEDLRGEPFVGAAGKLLDNMLKAVGLDRHGDRPQSHKVFIANVLKCRPPGNRNPQTEEIAQCEPHLARQIELLEPRIILALGRFAVQTLLAPTVPNVHAQPLGKLRGRVHRWHDIPVVVSYHPAYLLRSLPEKAKAWADLVLALQASKQAPARAHDAPAPR